jgi:hypothetical protein
MKLKNLTGNPVSLSTFKDFGAGPKVEVLPDKDLPTLELYKCFDGQKRLPAGNNYEHIVSFYCQEVNLPQQENEVLYLTSKEIAFEASLRGRSDILFVEENGRLGQFSTLQENLAKKYASLRDKQQKGKEAMKEEVNY